MSTRKIPLEVVVFDKLNALRAQALGAHRVELNAKGSYEDGGLTPSLSDLRALRQPRNPAEKRLDIPVRVMIRPRPAPGPTEAEKQDFIYSDSEYKTMWDAITQFKNLNALNPVLGDAFVFGILERVGPGATPKERGIGVDIRRCTMLVQHAMPIPCVFHRAFDALAACDDWKDSLNELVRCGFKGVLTSGGPGNFIDNLGRLAEMSKHLPELQIIVGGGVRADNAHQFTSLVKPLIRLNLWMHSSCHSAQPVEGQDAENIDSDELKGLAEALGHVDVD